MTAFSLWTSKKVVVFLDRQRLLVQIVRKEQLVACHETNFLPLDDEVLKDLFSQFSSYPLTLFLHCQHAVFQYVKSESLSFWQKRKMLFITHHQDFAFAKRLKREFLSMVTLDGTIFQQQWLNYFASCSNRVESCRNWVMDYAQQEIFQTGWQIIQTKTPVNQPIFIVLKEGNPLFARSFLLEKRAEEIKMMIRYLARYGFMPNDIVHIQEGPYLDLWRLPRFCKLHVPSIAPICRRQQIMRFTKAFSSFITIVAFVVGGMEMWRGISLKKEVLNMRQNSPILSEKLENYQEEFLMRIAEINRSFLPISHYLSHLKEILPPFIVITQVDWDSSQLRLKIVTDSEKENLAQNLIEFQKSLEGKIPGSHVHIQGNSLVLEAKKS